MIFILNIIYRISALHKLKLYFDYLEVLDLLWQCVYELFRIRIKTSA